MKIYQQNVFEKWPIEDESCQSLITSPPYYALRRYNIEDVIIGGDKDCKHEWGGIKGKKMSGGLNGITPDYNKQRFFEGDSNFCLHCQSWKGQYGLEPTPAAYVEHTRLWAKEAWRVLRKDGIMFLNLADSYSTISGGMNQMADKGTGNTPQYGAIPYKYEGVRQAKGKGSYYGSKCQLLIPHRVAIALVDDGWTLRNTIIWQKLNSMPESVTDRFSKKYEYIFMFTKSPKYYFDLDSVREPHKQVSIERLKRAVGNQNKWVKGADGQTKHGLSQPHPNYKDRIGSMQNAEFEGGDYLCGKLNPLGKNPADVWQIPTQPSGLSHFAMWPEKLVERMVKCSTKAGDTVLDPFCGSGTTLKVAEELQRIGIGIDLGYQDISKKRTATIQRRMW